MNERLKIAFIGIAVWWALLLPFDYTFFNWFFKTIQKPFFSGLQGLDSNLIFETDTYGTYVLLALSITLGVLSGFAINWFCNRFKLSPTDVLKTVLASILFFFLFRYGWDKLVKTQFYLPEPNTVYTPFGKLSKDIAYWSLIGSSHSYTFALGFIEVLTAALFLFKRTQFLASLLSVAIFGQIFLVNCSFDISVKLLSGSLLGFSLVYTACFPQQWRGILGFPSKPLPTETAKCRSAIRQLPPRVTVLRPKIHTTLKLIFVFLTVFESTLPSFLNGNLNDDEAPRLKHHGAYYVHGSPTVNHVFIHRNHYLVLELWSGEFVDYKITTADPNNYSAIKAPVSFLWDEAKYKLVVEQDTFDIESLPYRELPLFQESFHPFSDEFH